MESNIFILTGPVKSGKSTMLMDFVKSRNDISGILQPVIEGKRFIYFIDTGDKMQLELENGSRKKFIEIGKYKFDAAAIEWAKGSLLFAYSLKSKFLIIDEFGKLELKGEGLEPVVSEIINDCKQDFDNKIILVIRDYLLEDAISYLQLKPNEYRIISKDQLKTLWNQL